MLPKSDRTAGVTESVVQEVGATPEVVWEVVSDITRLGEWSPECQRCEWDSGQEPGLGATFTGHNRLGDIDWSNQSTVVEWEPQRKLTWEVRLTGPGRDMFGDDPFSRWGFSIEPTTSGTRVTQTTEDLRSEELKKASLAFLPEVQDRQARNLETMAATLEALAQACEQAT